MIIYGHISLRDNSDVGIINVEPLGVLSKNIACVMASSCGPAMMVNDTKQFVRDRVGGTTCRRDDFYRK